MRSLIQHGGSGSHFDVNCSSDARLLFRSGGMKHHYVLNQDIPGHGRDTDQPRQVPAIFMHQLANILGFMLGVCHIINAAISYVSIIEINAHIQVREFTGMQCILVP